MCSKLCQVSGSGQLSESRCYDGLITDVGFYRRTSELCARNESCRELCNLTQLIKVKSRGVKIVVV